MRKTQKINKILKTFLMHNCWFLVDSCWQIFLRVSNESNIAMGSISTLSCAVCTQRFHTWPTPFHSLYNSSWLGDLKKIPQISFVRWWQPAVHLFHSYKFCCISWNTYQHIRRIRHLLPLSTVTALANSLVSSKLDYCHSLYSGISQANLNKFQHNQNSLARVITNTLKYQQIKPTLKKLHYFPIKQRIDYKLCLLTYKTLTNQQPTYLYNSLSFPSHSVSTRSSDSLLLFIPCPIITWYKDFF